MAHSEEPWEMITPDDGWVSYTGDRDIGILAEGGLIAEVYEQIGEDKKADVEANARLMVHSPEMFRFIRELNEWCFSDDAGIALPFQPPWAEKMWEILKKVNGEDSPAPEKG